MTSPRCRSSCTINGSSPYCHTSSCCPGLPPTHHDRSDKGRFAEQHFGVRAPDLDLRHVVDLNRQGNGQVPPAHLLSMPFALSQPRALLYYLYVLSVPDALVCNLSPTSEGGSLRALIPSLEGLRPVRPARYITRSS